MFNHSSVVRPSTKRELAPLYVAACNVWLTGIVLSITKPFFSYKVGFGATPTHSVMTAASVDHGWHVHCLSSMSVAHILRVQH